MYKLKEIKHALKILEQYDFQFSKVLKATGIKVRTIKSCKYHNGIVGNYRLKMLVSNDSFSFCYNLITEVITNEKRYL